MLSDFTNSTCKENGLRLILLVRTTQNAVENSSFEANCRVPFITGSAKKPANKLFCSLLAGFKIYIFLNVEIRIFLSCIVMVLGRIFP